MWVITIATDPSDPDAGRNSRTLWAVPQSSETWGTPIRLGGPLGSPDSTQVQLSVKGGPGTNPRAVWIRHSQFSLSRLDLLTSAWDGTVWSLPERIGDLVDSSGAMWPDVVEYAGGIWAAYMRQLRSSPFNYNIFSLHSIVEPTSAAEADLEVQPAPDGVFVRWACRLSPEPRGLRVYRNPSAASGIASPPVDAVRLLEVGPTAVGSGSFIDTTVSSGEHDYWLELLLTPTGSAYIGPKRVHPMASASAVPRVTSTAPNPATGSIDITGQRGAAGAKVEVFDVRGRRVRSIEIHGQPGLFTVRWDGRTSAGSLLSSGVYFLRVYSQDGRHSEPKRVLLVH
jgi:hypothetical protein